MCENNYNFVFLFFFRSSSSLQSFCWSIFSRSLSPSFGYLPSTLVCVDTNSSLSVSFLMHLLMHLIIRFPILPLFHDYFAIQTFWFLSFSCRSYFNAHRLLISLKCSSLAIGFCYFFLLFVDCFWIPSSFEIYFACFRSSRFLFIGCSSDVRHGIYRVATRISEQFLLFIKRLKTTATTFCHCFSIPTVNQDTEQIHDFQTKSGRFSLLFLSGFSFLDSLVDSMRCQDTLDEWE